MTTIRHYIHEYGRLFAFLLVLALLGSIIIWAVFFSDIVKNFFLWLDNFIRTQPRYVYLVAFLAAVAEGTVLLGVMPGTTYVITMGIFWSRGLVDPFLLFPIVITGAFLGDFLGYALGSFSSKHFLFNYKKKKPYLLAREFVKKHGAKSVFMARFISGIKEVVPFTAGILHMDLKKFIFWNFLGGVGWSVLWIMAGYVSGSFVTRLESMVKYIGVIILVFLISSAVVFYRKNKETLILHDEV